MNAPPSAQVYEPIHDDDFAQTPDDLIHPDLLAQSRQSVTIPQVRQEELVSMLQVLIPPTQKYHFDIL